MIGFIVRYFERQRELGRLQAAELARREKAYFDMGASYLRSLEWCPDCKQDPADAVLGSYQDGMEVRLRYCQHAVHIRAYLDKPAFNEMHALARAAAREHGVRLWGQK